MEQIEVKLTTWAYPNKYRTEDEPEFNFITVTGNGKPYFEDAFIVHEEHLELLFEMPEDVITPQVDALTEAINKEKEHYHAKLREYQDRIQNLLSLPAPKSV